MDGRKLTETHLRHLGIPRVHWGARLDRIPDKCQHKPRLREYVDAIVDNVRRPRGLFLFGEYSSGKSASAAICLKAAACQRIYGYWVFAKRLPHFIIQATPWDAEQTVYERCLAVPLLVVDEFQMRENLAYTEFSLEDLVRMRVDDGLATIITTNHTPKEVKARYPALGEVLHEAVVPVKVAGHNFRAELGKELADG